MKVSILATNMSKVETFLLNTFLAIFAFFYYKKYNAKIIAESILD